MFPLFITHDEYFVRCGGSGEGYYNVFDLSSYELLSGQRQCDGSALAAVRQRQAGWRRCGQRGGGWQRGSAGSMMAAAGLAAAVEVWRHHSVSGGSRVAGATLPPRAATVAVKTPVATAMAGALPTINNQLKAAAAMPMETMTTTTHKT
jgi:hypothetical protein